MNLGTLAGFLSLGMELWAAHMNGDAEKIKNTGATLQKMALDLDKLHMQETGKPIDWDKIKKHEHLL